MKIDDSVKPFLKKHRISVLTVLLESGEPHSASLHYAWEEKTEVFVFFTRTSTVKFKAIEKGPSRGSLVVGFSDEEFCTLQMRGEVRICNSDLAKQVYCEKYRHILEFLRDSNAVFIEFEPNWFRYSDLKPSKPIIISSHEIANESSK
jgi:uncharacterized protein YhbP (UPF0306 family)